MKSYLGEAGTEQFTVTTFVNDQQIKEQRIHDPFIRSTVRLKGWKHAWNSAFHEIKVNIVVDSSEGAQRAIMTMNPNQLQRDTDEILTSRAASRSAHGNGGDSFCQALGL